MERVWLPSVLSARPQSPLWLSAQLSTHVDADTHTHTHTHTETWQPFPVPTHPTSLRFILLLTTFQPITAVLVWEGGGTAKMSRHWWHHCSVCIFIFQFHVFHFNGLKLLRFKCRDVLSSCGSSQGGQRSDCDVDQHGGYLTHTETNV